MVYQETDRNEVSRVELAQGGHLPSLAWWLNQRLAPHRLQARLSYVKPGYIRIVLDLRPASTQDPRSPEFKKRTIRFICHQLWRLNSDVLDGAYVVAAYAGKAGILWKQSVRIVSPARRTVLELAKQSEAENASLAKQQVQKRIRKASQQKQQFQAMRSLLVSGSSAAAFVIGCWLGYADAPPELTAASARGSAPSAIVQNHGAKQVNAALETVPIIQHKAANSDPAVNLLFGGDVTLTDAYSDKVGRDHQWAFAQLPESREADISMVNLEAPFTQHTQALPGKKFNFKAPVENVQVLQNGGIDIVNLANNHTMDYRGAGLAETIATLDKAGIRSIGAGADVKAARRPVIMEVKGQKVAYLGYYDADLHAATASSPGTNPRHNDRVAADIKALRSQVDWIVVNYHWGEELAKYPGDWQIDLARFTVDQGADLVVGHHAHVLQGAEVYKGRPIVYSLGNFVFGGKAVSDYDTAALKVSLKEQQMKVEFLPVQVRNFQPKVVNGQSGQQILSQITNVSDIFQMPMTSAMTMDLKTNQAHAIEAGKDVPAIPSGTDANAAPNADLKQKPDASKVDQQAEPKAEPKADSPTLPKTPDPDNPWSQDSFTTPGKSEPLLKPAHEQGKLPATMKPEGSLEAQDPIETALVSQPKEVTIEDVEKESMAAGESTLIPEGVSPDSDAARDTVISAPEPPAANVVEQPAATPETPVVVTPVVTPVIAPEVKPAEVISAQPNSGQSSLEPMQKRYAEASGGDLEPIAVIPQDTAPEQPQAKVLETTDPVLSTTPAVPVNR